MTEKELTCNEKYLIIEAYCMKEANEMAKRCGFPEESWKWTYAQRDEFNLYAKIAREDKARELNYREWGDDSGLHLQYHPHGGI